MALGRFVLPDLPAGALGQATGEVGSDRCRRLLARPVRTELKNGFFLVWTEMIEDLPEVIVWRPTTAGEVADAKVFWRACCEVEGAGPETTM